MSTTSSASNEDTAAQQPQSHRVYWQQRLSGSGNGSSVNNNNNNSNNNSNNNNNLITGSAAVKISYSAKARDLSNLLRKTLHLGVSNNYDGDSSSGSDSNNNTIKDSLVLVGTLRSVPRDYVSFEHEQEPHSGDPNNAPNRRSGSISSKMEDFHVVKTLDAKDPCLSVLQKMKAHLLERQRAIDHKSSKDREIASPKRRNVLSLRPTIAPQTRWYYVPDTTTPNSSSTKQQPTMSSCLELDGYLTSFDDDDSDDEYDCNSENDDQQGNDNESVTEAVYGDDEDLLRRVLAPFQDDNDNEKNAEPESRDSISREDEKQSTIHGRRRSRRATPKAEKIAKEWRRYLQISQSHVASDKTNASSSTSNVNTTLAGFLLKRSCKDTHVWKRHYCVLTQDDFWYVPRVIRDDEFVVFPREDEEDKSSSELQHQHGGDDSIGSITRTIEIAQTHGRISLSDATLLSTNLQTKSRRDDFELISGDGRAHTFRACSPIVSAGAATHASIASAKEWQRMLRTRIRDALENSLTKHAELLVIDETVARNDRWRNFIIAAPSGENETEMPSPRKNGAASILHGSTNNNGRPSVLHFGLDVAEYKEGCRQIQNLLWAEMAGATSTPSSSSAAMDVIRRLVKDLWREATSLLDRALRFNANIVGNSNTKSPGGPTNHRRRGLEPMCHHIEYVITQKRRRPSHLSSFKESSSNKNLVDTTATNEASDATDGDQKQLPTRDDDYPHQRDPPPIDLFDLLWSELRKH